MTKLDELLTDIDLVDFPYAGMRERALELNISDTESLLRFIETETLINRVGDKLSADVRALGTDTRRDVAINMLKATGKIPADYE